MAHSPPAASARAGSWAFLVVLGGLVGAPAHAAVSLEECNESIEVEGDGLQGNFRSSTTELRAVVITGCDMRIEARLARFSSLDFQDSTWSFEGAVRITLDTQLGRLQSDQAVVRFRDNQVERVTITGSPAQFERNGSGSGAASVRGHAREVVYDLDAGTVRLAGDAWLSSPGSGSIEHQQIVYDIRKQQFQTASRPGAGDRVRMTITPKAASGRKEDKEDEEKPKDGAANDTTPAPSPDAPPR